MADVLPVTLSGEAHDGFCKRLGWIAAQYRLSEAWRDAPSPSEMRKRLQAIQRAAQRLTDQLGMRALPEEDIDVLDELSYPLRSALVSAAETYGASVGGYPDHPPTEWRTSDLPKPIMDFHGDSKVAAAVMHVQLIGAWSARAVQATREKAADDAAERIKRYGGKGQHARNPGNEPLNALVAQLAVLYWTATGRKPGFSRPHGRGGLPGGPFFRFVLAVCERMQVPLTATALEKRWRTVGPTVPATRRVERIIDRISGRDPALRK